MTNDEIGNKPDTDAVGEPTREQINAWLTANCGTGLPYDNATTVEQMLHGLAYVHRQIACSRTYEVNIGQTGPAITALQMALDHFARAAIISARAPAQPGGTNYWDWVSLATNLRYAVGPGPEFTELEKLAIEAAVRIERMCGSLI